MSILSVNGPKGSSLPTNVTAMEEAASVVPHFQVGAQPPPDVPSLDQRRIEVLPPGAPSQAVKRRFEEGERPLEDDEASAVQVAKRALPNLTEKCLLVQNHLSRYEHFWAKNCWQEAADALLEVHQLASQLPDPFAQANLLEKLDRAMLLTLATHDPRIEHLLLQKDWIRKCFEDHIKQLVTQSTQKKQPICFVCFEKDKETIDWLENIFVPDLDMAGIAPLFYFREYGPSEYIERFNCLSFFADSLVIICTPELKKKCVEYVDNPTGCAMQISLATGRSAIAEKWKSIYPVCINGDYRDLCPHPYFQEHLAVTCTNFGNCVPTMLYSYYAGAFELIGAIRGIDREISRKARDFFLSAAQKILREKKIEDAVQQQRVEDSNRSKDIRVKVSRIIEESLGHPLTLKGRLRLKPAHPHFVGRSELLGQLNTTFFQLQKWKPQKQNWVHVLHGPGGMGKTELAITFGNRHVAEFFLVWFLRAETPELLEKDYRELAEALSVDISHKDLFQDVQDKVHRALEIESRKWSRPWLLIIDNVTAQIEIPGRDGYVIATAQSKNILKDANAYDEVPPFSPQDTESLFQLMKCSLSKSDAENLVVEMEGFPVLIEQVAKFLRRIPSYTLEQYLKEIQKDEMIWESRDGERYPRRLGKVFEATLARLSDQKREAYDFIRFCAYLNPDCISIHLFDFWIENKGLTAKDRREILEALHDFLLLRYDLSSRTYSCHRLLQLVLQGQDKEGEVYRSTLETCAKWIGSIMIKMKDHESVRVGESIAPHLEKMRKAPLWKAEWKDHETQKKIIQAQTFLLTQVGNWRCSVNPKNREGLELLNEALTLGKTIFKEDSLEIAEFEEQVGLLYLVNGDKSKAARHLGNSLTVFEARQSILQAANCYFHLASTFPLNSSEANKCYQKALQLYENPAIAESGAIHNAYNNLVEHYLRIERHDIALDLINKLIKSSEDRHRQPHPVTGRLYLKKGHMLLSSGQPREALGATQTGIEKLAAFCGKTQVEVADGYLVKGVSYRTLKEFDHAARMFDESEKIFCDLHLTERRARIVIGKGEILAEQKGCREAREISQQALIMLSSIHQESPDEAVAFAYLQTARILSLLANYQEALRYLETARSLVQQRVQSRFKAEIFHNIAITLKNSGKEREALPYYAMAIGVQLQQQGKLPFE